MDDSNIKSFGMLALVVAEDHDITERLECQDESEPDIYKVEKRR